MDVLGGEESLEESQPQQGQSQRLDGERGALQGRAAVWGQPRCLAPRSVLSHSWAPSTRGSGISSDSNCFFI